jgi:hypothetical protein
MEDKKQTSFGISGLKIVGVMILVVIAFTYVGNKVIKN